jgi:outer membrane protein assembly factor BamB
MKNLTQFVFVSLLLVSCSKLKLDSSRFKPHAPARKVEVVKIIWTKDHEAKYESGNMPIGQASPTIADGKIFAGSLRQEFYQYRLDNGFLERKWKVEGIVTGQPIVFNGQVVIATLEGRAYCFDLKNGKTVWERDIGAPFESMPAFHQGRLFFHMRNHAVISIDASTGKMIWSYKRSVPYLTTYQRVSHPVFLKTHSLSVLLMDTFFAFVWKMEWWSGKEKFLRDKSLSMWIQLL